MFFAKVVGFFACFVLLFGVLVFSLDSTDEVKTGIPQGKINLETVCKNALLYMTFVNGIEADKFVAECIDGKHPEVMQKFIKDRNLDSATI